MIKLGGLIINIRRTYGISVNRFSEITGLSPSFIYDLEAERTQGSIETLNKIADGLKRKLSLNVIIRIEDDSHTDVIADEKARAYDDLIKKLKGIVDGAS